MLRCKVWVGVKLINYFLESGFEAHLDIMAADEMLGASWVNWGGVVFAVSDHFLHGVPLTEGEFLGGAVGVLHLLCDNVNVAARNEFPFDTHVSNLRSHSNALFVVGRFSSVEIVISKAIRNLHPVGTIKQSFRCFNSLILNIRRLQYFKGVNSVDLVII